VSAYIGKLTGACSIASPILLVMVSLVVALFSDMVTMATREKRFMSVTCGTEMALMERKHYLLPI